MPRPTYNHQAIEPAMQQRWREQQLYVTDLADTTKDPYYLLVEFPYPSGDLHTGHWYAFAVTDIFARYKRMEGKNVLFPFGFDAFGLPAENAAIKRGLDPKKWTYENMDTMRTQVQSMGTSLDFSKEVVTCDPAYYQWTQWLFTKLLEQGLVERRAAPVKWCPSDRTVLANEQVVAGACERCGTTVEEKVLTQWFMKITAYAKRLLDDLDALPWRNEIKDAQRAWIGESEGAHIPFAVVLEAATSEVEYSGEQQALEMVTVFTTRPDTLFGVTYIVVAPEHPLVASAVEADLCTNAEAVQQYVTVTQARSERERMEQKEKTGVRLEGINAVHPLTGEALPIFAADYVLGNYGTGAVMAVPGHDARDFAFAQAFSLPIKDVVMPRLPDPTNPQQPGKETIFRTVTINIVYDPATDRYLTLRWLTQPWITFVTGGVEEGEDMVESAIREIAEETGYTDVRFVRKLGGDAQAEFYAAHKGVNRTARDSMLLFELASDARNEVAVDESAQHVPEWISAEAFKTVRLQHSEAALIRERILTGMDAYEGEGILVNSGAWDGKESSDVKWQLAEAAGGTRTTTYRLRDWLVSRQRYWGCPIPVVYDPEGKAHAIPAEHLPWTLPEDVDFSPSGVSPLATSKELQERVVRIFGEGWTPECDTLDTFIDSSWYFLRYLAPTSETAFSDPAIMKRWLPVQRYSGGSEHTTMHLLYARFFHKALYDLALVPTPEPFYERMNRGLILGPDGLKMSKSKGNVINPDEFVQAHGADAVRMYLAFIGPYNEPGSYPWKPEGVASMRRFLDRVYALKGKLSDDIVDSERTTAMLAKAALRIGADIERFKLNTAVSGLMILVNTLEAEETISKNTYEALICILAPFAPHLAEHLYASDDSIHLQPWPTFPDVSLEEEMVTLGVQIAGKRRAEITIAPDASEEDALAAALAIEKVRMSFPNGIPSKVIYVAGRILNLIP